MNNNNKTINEDNNNNNNNNNKMIETTIISSTINGGQQQNEKLPKSVADSGEETEGEDEVLEESPDRRWAKRKERVFQRDALAIDKAFLAMDTENAYEVVWNEINIAEKENPAEESSINKLEQFFENLLRLNHINVVKFHAHWIDRRNNKQPRIIFITEYMASGSLKQFLRNAKKTNQPIKKSTWRRWCIQLLTALHYLHNCDPPIVHRELSCDTIYIQHNGLMKIGSISPDILHTCAKLEPDNNIISKTAHFIAPEIRHVNNRNNEASVCGPEVDIYSFGIVALEMFNMELGGNGDTHTVTDELIEQSIAALEDEKQKDFLKICLNNDPTKRQTSYDLLFHPLLFEIPTLKRLSAHYYYKYNGESHELNLENLVNKNRLYHRNQNEMISKDENDNGSISSSNTTTAATRVNEDFIAIGRNEHKYANHKFIEDLSKYMEDVKAGLHPSTAFLPSYKDKQSSPINPILNNVRDNLSGTHSPDISDNENSVFEKRKAQELLIRILTQVNEPEKYTLVITVSFEDKRKRDLQAELTNNDTAYSIADELIKFGLISEVDKDALIKTLNDTLKIRDDKLEDKTKNKDKGGALMGDRAIECQS